MKKITSLFYETSSGNKPVREWLLSLDKEDKKTIGNDIKTVEYGFPIGMPICRKLIGTKLYEVRSNISNQRIARVIFVIIDEYMILLNGFIKKEQKTPKNEVDIALQRMKDIKWT
ncbi:type II toxin-antitoxin system RelE/ParE family toxin [Aliarcobacter butzleri]|uniref:type II toxin-antitoxin system RelE/ParE family toxin n=1 Tax=Aliarcobacter butzleri TaxID=28197 RepID=UPI00263E12D5|nr:type II toxin-antitoxin system RelE/ParE family toxin [Aliarcobacter butzleri]MDN5068270.1 type II toxin-antitoxin system RelE/ParE family toxin [Aliarcobacter butzleri]